MSDGSQFDAEYFLRGRESGKSLYEDYRWMPDLTIPMVEVIAAHCGFRPGARVLDFGCARGYVVKALRGLGYDARGVDVSRWAIDNADEEAAPYLEFTQDATWTDCTIYRSPLQRYDWVVAKDVLEHVVGVAATVRRIMESADVGVFAVVPLSRVDLGEYVVGDYEWDVTHLHRWTLATWVRLFLRQGWAVEARYRLPGVKDNYAGWTDGNGFLTARRV